MQETKEKGGKKKEKGGVRSSQVRRGGIPTRLLGKKQEGRSKKGTLIVQDLSKKKGGASIRFKVPRVGKGKGKRGGGEKGGKNLIERQIRLAGLAFRGERGEKKKGKQGQQLSSFEVCRRAGGEKGKGEAKNTPSSRETSHLYFLLLEKRGKEGGVRKNPAFIEERVQADLFRANKGEKRRGKKGGKTGPHFLSGRLRNSKVEGDKRRREGKEGKKGKKGEKGGRGGKGKRGRQFTPGIFSNIHEFTQRVKGKKGGGKKKEEKG